MTREHVASLLEIASFFLVSLDLYGEERLERLGKRISNSDKIRDVGRRTTNWFYHSKTAGVFIFLFLSAILGFVISWLLGESKRELLTELATWVYWLAVLAGFIFFMYLLVNYLSITILLLLLFISRCVARYKLSGWMMLSGTILFGISKYLSW